MLSEPIKSLLKSDGHPTDSYKDGLNLMEEYMA